MQKRDVRNGVQQAQCRATQFKTCSAEIDCDQRAPGQVRKPGWNDEERDSSLLQQPQRGLTAEHSIGQMTVPDADEQGTSLEFARDL